MIWYSFKHNKKKILQVTKKPKTNKTKQKISLKILPPTLSQKQTPHFFFFWMDQWDKRIQWLAKSNSYCTHWQWNRKKKSNFHNHCPKEMTCVEIFLECDDGVSLPWYTEGMYSHSHHRTRKEVKLEKN